MTLGIMVNKENEKTVDVLLGSYKKRLEKKLVDNDEKIMYVPKEDAKINATDFFRIITLTKNYHVSKKIFGKQNTMSWFEGFFNSSLNSSVQLNDAKEMDVAIDLIGSYNCFSPEETKQWLNNYIHSVRVYYGKNNLNNGIGLFDLSIGRVGSPVIYGKAYVHLIDNKNFSSVFLSKYLKKTGKLINSDIFEVDKNNSYVKFKVWWD